MKIAGGFLLFNSVFAGPTRPPVSEECPTDCQDILNNFNNFNNFNKGARPDFDLEGDCDLSGLTKKCEEELATAATTEEVTTTTVQDEQDFPDYMYEPRQSDGTKNEICTTFPDVCCPLMVAKNLDKSHLFSEATNALITNPQAENACLAEGNYPCCVKTEFCLAYPDLPHCSVTEESDYTPGIDVSESESNIAPSTDKSTTTTPKTTTTTAGPTTTTEQSIEEATGAPLSAKAVQEQTTVPGKDNKLEEDAGKSSTNWLIVGGVLGGIFAIVGGVFLAKKFGNRSGYTPAEPRLIVNQKEPSGDGQTSVDMQQESQQRQ